eukprot:Hpha_TRINITY_DN26474_c0_g1::TRINITY_DN26474_c0_g1_i1::g.33949::m.33949
MANEKMRLLFIAVLFCMFRGGYCGGAGGGSGCGVLRIAAGNVTVWEKWMGPPCVWARVEIETGATLLFRSNTTDEPVGLSAALIIINGTMQAGTEAAPFLGSLVISLVYNSSVNATFPELPNWTTKALVVQPGGRLSLHGAPKRSWGRAVEDTPRGARSLLLDSKCADLGWAPGDSVVVAPNGPDFAATTEGTVTAIRSGSGKTCLVSLSTPVEAGARGGDVGTEVALLSRNIILRGMDPAKSNDSCPDMTTMSSHMLHSYPWADPTAGCFGGHLVFLEASEVQLSGVEISGMGQANHLARYPVHWHLAGPSSGSYIRDAAVHHCFQRCVVVHGTQGVHVNTTACYRTMGHGFYLEDAVETGNILAHNLALRILPGPLLCSDNPYGLAEGHLVPPAAGPSRGPSGFWITNPNNTFLGNVAAGVGGVMFGSGFWVALPHTTFEPSRTIFASRGWWGASQIPSTIPFLMFADNVAHSQYHGFTVDGAPRASAEPQGEPPPGMTCAAQGTGYYSVTPAGTWTTLSRVVAMDNLMGLWLTVESFTLDAPVLLRNGIGMLLEDVDYFSGVKKVRNAVLAGTDPGTFPMCVHQPLDQTCKAYPIRGVAIYDGPLCFQNVSATQFSNTVTRNASVFGLFDNPTDYINPFVARGLRGGGGADGINWFHFQNPSSQRGMLGRNSAVVFVDGPNGTAIVEDSAVLVSGVAPAPPSSPGGSSLVHGVGYHRMLVKVGDEMDRPLDVARWMFWAPDNRSVVLDTGVLFNLNTRLSSCSQLVPLGDGIARFSTLHVQTWWLPQGSRARGRIYLPHVKSDFSWSNNYACGDGPAVPVTVAPSAQSVWTNTTGSTMFYDPPSGFLTYSLLATAPLTSTSPQQCFLHIVFPWPTLLPSVPPSDAIFTNHSLTCNPDSPTPSNYFTTWCDTT